jgi:hypothetical protein
VDRLNNPIPAAIQNLSVDYTGPVPDPVGALVISELMFAPTTPGAQFIEIVNRSPFNFDLWGWRLDGVGLSFPPGSIVTNGQRIVLAQNRTAFTSAYGSVPLFALFNGSLSSSGEAIVLVQPGAMEDVLVNGVPYETTAPWPGAMAGASLQLIDVTQDNSRPSNWAMDALALATPGAPNSVAASLPPYDALWLNEAQIVSLTDTVDNFGEADPWIEIYNSGPTSLSLAGYYLADNYTSNLTEWAFPAGAIVAPGEHKLIWADGQPEQSTTADIHTNFRLGPSENLALVRLLNSAPQITDYLTWGNLGANLGYGSVPDGQTLFRMVLHHPTPRETNTEPALRVFINEWMARNTAGIRDPADNAQDDWFELFNAEPFTVDLSGFYLTDTAADPVQYHIPTNGQYQIAPRSYLLVWADDQPSQNAPNRADLHANFALSSTAGDIGLFAPDGVTPVDLISYATQTNDVSEGRYTDGASARYSMTRSTPRGTNSIPTYNSPPTFPFIPNQVTVPGQTCCGPMGFLNVQATDPDGNILTYAIESAPPGSLLNAGGLYRWIVPTNQPPGNYAVTLSVIDDGIPPRAAVTTFLILVRSLGSMGISPPPVIQTFARPPGQFTLTFDAVVGRTYRVFYTDDLASEAWAQLDRDFVAANVTASITDMVHAPRRFYRVLQVD